MTHLSDRMSHAGSLLRTNDGNLLTGINRGQNDGALPALVSLSLPPFSVEDVIPPTGNFERSRAITVGFL